MESIRQTITAFFKDYGTALLSLSAIEISKFYRVPMAVYSDYGVTTIAKEREVVAFWEQGVKPYSRLSISEIEPEVFDIEQLSEKNYIAKVNWTSYDASRNTVAGETNFYILTEYGAQQFRIAGLIIMSVNTIMP